MASSNENIDLSSSVKKQINEVVRKTWQHATTNRHSYKLPKLIKEIHQNHKVTRRAEMEVLKRSKCI